MNDSERLVFEAQIDAEGHCKPKKVNETKGRLKRWKNRHVLVTVTRWVKPKTLPQLGLYFGPILTAWSEYTGFTPEETHVELKRAFLAPRLAIARLTGEERTELPSLADLTSEEMSEYCDRCIREGALLGIEFDLERAAS